MDEPTWTQEARRDKTGHNVRYPRTAARHHRRPIMLRSRFVWLARCLGWLDRLVQRFPLVTRTQRASIAAHRARAVLDGMLLTTCYTPADMPTKLLPAAQAHAPVPIPARYIAHSVSIMVVLIVVLMPGDVSLSVDTPLVHEMSAQRSTQEQDSDLRVVRTLPLGAPMATDGELMLPVLRALPPQSVPIFIENHQVVEGETLGEIAARYQVSVASLFWPNNLQNNDVLAVGQELKIPRVSGISHVVQPDDTLESIAQQYNVFPEALLRFRANNIGADRQLPVGREIFILNGTQPYSAETLARYGGEQGIANMRAAVAGVTQEAQINLRAGPGREYPRLSYLEAGRQLTLIARYGEWVKVENGSTETGWVRSDLLGLPEAAINVLPETTDFLPPPPRWVWPTTGEMTSSFGWRSQPFRSFHDGLDLANRAGTPIVAASAGRVIQAGWCGGFGYCVEIDHGEGITTLYAHMLKRPPVASGDTLAAGDLVGWMGNTYDKRRGGFSTGVHLHFITKVNGKAINPLRFLS